MPLPLGATPALYRKRFPRPSLNRLVAGLVLGLPLVVVACNGGGPGPSAPPPDEVVRVRDGLGRQVAVGRSVHRVVAFSPGAVRLLEGVGALDRLVAVGPSVAPGLPERVRIGGRPAAARLDELGQVAGLEADLVVVDRAAYEDWLREAEADLAVPLFVFEPRSLEELMGNLERLGLALGQGRQAREAVAEMRQRLERVRAAVEDAPEVPAYWISLGQAPPPWFQELAEWAGGDWVGGNSEGLIPQEASPEVMVALSEATGLSPAELLAGVGPERLPDEMRSQFPGNPAIQDGRFFRLPADLVLVPGPQLALGVEVLAHLFHPDRVTFPEP